MPHLYRSQRDTGHWFVFVERQGWLQFPARLDGWHQRRPRCGIAGLELREVPLWLAFGTGLWESARVRRLRRAA